MKACNQLFINVAFPRVQYDSIVSIEIYKA